MGLSRDVAYWHIAAFAAPQTFVGYWTNNGQKATQRLNGSAAIDPMYGPAVRCKWILPSWR
jgi:hypothetical protein